ncbi:cache domain-containing protein [Sulfurimonas sp.]|uniref:HAMP domain-containing protein n=1 Tax=Sulfurimonas sp. TaxID=2022749 RepID=UPI0025E2214A|nr:cache domain-containing protein [Sulfurimonas sp.]
MNFNISLQNKIFFIFIIVLSMSISLVGWFGYKTTSNGYIESAYEISERDINNLTVKIEGTLIHVTKDAQYIKKFYALKRYLLWKSMSVETKEKRWKNIFSDALLDFLKAQKDYYQIRVISLDGHELLVVNYEEKNNNAYVVLDSGLQNKSGRDYVEIPKTLSKDEFFISDMNLNKEYGKIEKPFNPVLRYSTPMISDNGDMIGIFTVNIYAQNILDIVKQASLDNAKKGFSYFLIDKDGNYLFHEDESKRWGAQIKGKSNFNDDHFNLKSMMQDKSKGTFILNNKIYSYHTVHPLKENSENYWYAVSSVDTEVALAKLDDFEELFVLILLFVIMISFFIIKFYLLRITTPLAQVTSQLKALSKGETPIPTTSAIST